MRSSLPPGPMRALPSSKMLDPVLQQPAPQRLVAERNPVALGQLLRRQRRAKIPVPLLVQLQGRRLPRLGDPAVGRFAAPPMHQASVALLLHPSLQAPDLPIREAQQGACFLLRELLRHHLPDHMHPTQFLSTHHDPVLSDHPALLLKADSLALKRTFLSW